MTRTVTIRKIPRRQARSIAAALAALTMPPASASAQTIEQKAQLCTACHGESGAGDGVMAAAVKAEFPPMDGNAQSG